MTTYYNEIEPFKADWLRELMKAGVIAEGKVDERDIREIQPDDLRGFAQCHFFAGIGVWSYALRQAGWPDSESVWTGSCPCQPFSVAGKRGKASDDRHLWPAWFRLIRESRPSVVFGEQVAGDDGLAWLDVVSADLEDAGYACGAVDTCAAGFGAPELRQRLYFVAESERMRRSANFGNDDGWLADDSRASTDGRMADAAESRRARTGQHDGGPRSLPARSEQFGEVGRMADATDGGTGWASATEPGGHQSENGILGAHSEAGKLGDAEDREKQRLRKRRARNGSWELSTRRSSAINCFWADAEWLPCRDGKYRPVEPGTFPLAHGAPARVGRLRGYGDAIVAPQAEAFIRAYLEIRNW